MKTALIIGSSKGIGKSIKIKLRELKIKMIAPTRKELDTSKLNSVKKFIKNLNSVDYLILNTGGPPAKDFFSISENDWNKYYIQLFLSFVLILQKIKIKKNGFMFLISSHTIKNPEDNLVLSNSYRVAISSVFKTVSKIYSKKKITCINIAPGPIKTDRLRKLVKNMKEFEKKLPLARAGNPDEIALFVQSIIKLNIKYLNGVIINFDGGLSKNLM
jgi:3-oxoacyl-[acyl-carrier protein] reductase